MDPARPGFASDSGWTLESFNRRLRTLKHYKARPNTNKEYEADRKSLKIWRAGGGVGKFYGQAIREMFLGNPPAACSHMGGRPGDRPKNCPCEPCHWLRRFDSWLPPPGTPKDSAVAHQLNVDPAGLASLPTSADTGEAAWVGDEALEQVRQFVELHVHDTNGVAPFLTVSLSYGYQRFEFPESEGHSALRCKMQPTSLVIHVAIEKAQKVFRTIYGTDRVRYSNDRWIVDASRSQNDMFPLVEQALVQLERTLPDAMVTLTVTCSRDDFDTEIENPPAVASATDLRVLERVFQQWPLGEEKGEIVLVRGALRRAK